MVDSLCAGFTQLPLCFNSKTPTQLIVGLYFRALIMLTFNALIMFEHPTHLNRYNPFSCVFLSPTKNESFHLNAFDRQCLKLDCKRKKGAR